MVGVRARCLVSLERRRFSLHFSNFSITKSSLFERFRETACEPHLHGIIR